MEQVGKLAKRGFTLVEVLVACAILSLLVVLLASVFSAAQTQFTMVDSGSRQRLDAAAMLEVIAGDLRAAVQSPVQNFETGNPATPTNDARQLQMLVNPTNLPTELRNAGSIFWTTSRGTTLGGTSLVGYFLRWETAAGSARPVLCRYFVSGGGVENRLQILRGQATNNTVWVNDSNVTAVAPANANNGYQGWVADGVLAIYIRVLDPEGRPISNYARAPINVTYIPVNATSDNTYYRTEFSPASADTNGAAITSNFYDSLQGFSYRRSAGSVWLNVSGPAMPPLVEIILVTAPMRMIKRLTTPPTRVDSGNPGSVWNDVDAFVAGLPASLKNQARVVSTTVALTR
ncbi:MAG: prepilin-type N-terminal cleavage/methylation domain-containing protein [Verrucomicrobia bacterium]|nr:prepilin-type N-terminal cleavage/methylation domain-containing protein [Verrucomicrobiota bacterium]